MCGIQRLPRLWKLLLPGLNIKKNFQYLTTMSKVEWEVVTEEDMVLENVENLKHCCI